ncbi:IS1595 family transposase [Francisella philomiragia]|uniref:Transposase n=3 Tax=Francisella philomiragia TaxID=28110 RepID=A0AAW3DC35_9GAMM|nr:IS1595 family transposase [Francisella philomiragia]KFJ41924.1 putative transposase [Francisella philomiragia]KFJ43595.1 putative transposase [Francisella philomiragia]KFJ43661.1 putative transposase [Francisella philomiragia]
MRKSRLSTYKQDKLIELFIAGSTARTASELVSVNKTTASYYFHRLRLLIYQNSEHLEMFTGEIEVDESYFGGSRKGKRGRGASGKVPVFGLLKRNGKVYTVIIPDAKSNTLLPIIREKVKPDSIVYTDTFRSYNALDVSEFKHYRINHSKLFAKKHNHINGIENFWNQAKRHLRKFNGIPRDHFYLFLKECEWRFNHSDSKEQLKLIRHWVRESLK